MKKLLLLLLLVLSTTVYAKENKLYFIREDNAIKYESGLYDEKLFMKHTDMIPGGKYYDELIIENGTEVPYKLYFKVSKENQSEAAENLLKNITMKITLDDKLIYEGGVNGYGNTNLTDSILLGEFAPGKEVKMKVETNLSVLYENPKDDDFSFVDWTFYAQYEYEPPVPITGSTKSNYVIIISIVLLVVAIVSFIIYKRYKTKKAI